jgi:hypothetical protein
MIRLPTAPSPLTVASAETVEPTRSAAVAALAESATAITNVMVRTDMASPLLAASVVPYKVNTS